VTRKYFYRRHENDSWTPWEEIKLDIEDNPVIPVVWNERLFLFWLRILQQTALVSQSPFGKSGSLTSLMTTDIKMDLPMVSVQAVLCWSEYYNGKWQPTKTSDINRPTEKFWGDGRPIVPDLGVIEPDPMRRFVSEDAYIHYGLGATGIVI